MTPPLDRRSLALSAATAALALLALATEPAAQTYPVNAMVQLGNNPPQTEKIGDLVIRKSANGKGVFADFNLDPVLGPIVDGWYDFLWVHVERFYIVAGQVQTSSRLHGPLPAIAPQHFMRPGAGPVDDFPFVHDPAETRNGFRKGNPAVIFRVEGQRTNFQWSIDDEPPPPCSPPPSCKTEVIYSTYLVAYDTSSPGRKANEFCVLTGFEWTYEHEVGTGAPIHRVLVGPQIPDNEGRDVINKALGNANPAFRAPGGVGAWTATIGCTLVECNLPKSFGIAPSVGVSEGFYVMSATPNAPGNEPGLVIVDPAGRRPPIPVQGLPAAITGVGSVTRLDGATSVAVTGNRSNVLYVGTAVVGNQPPPFHRAEMHRLVLDSRGVVIVDEVIATIDNVSTFASFVAIETINDDDEYEDEGDDAYGFFDDDDEDFGTGPLVHYDASARQVSYPTVTGALPDGIPVDMSIDPTGSTAYLAYLLATGTGTEIVSVPVEGGMVRPVASLPYVIDNMACHPQTGVLHLTGFKLSNFRQSYVRVDPRTGAITDVPNNLATAKAGLAFEEASGDLILASNFSLERMTENGVVSSIRSGVGAGWGNPSDIAVVPSPKTYGKGTPGLFGVTWDLPPQRAGGGGAADLPIAGNQSFAVSLSAGGFDLVGAIALAAAPASPPIRLLGVELLIDPTSALFIPFAPGPVARLPLPLPANLRQVHLYAQGVFLDGVLLITSSGLKISTIE